MPNDYGPNGNAVLSSMQRVHFDFFGSNCTFYGLYMGSGLMASVFLAVSAAITWFMGKPGVKENPVVARSMRPIAASLVVAYVGVTVLAWRFFFVGPVVVSVAVTGLLGRGYWELMMGVH